MTCKHKFEHATYPSPTLLQSLVPRMTSNMETLTVHMNMDYLTSTFQLQITNKMEISTYLTSTYKLQISNKMEITTLLVHMSTVYACSYLWAHLHTGSPVCGHHRGHVDAGSPIRGHRSAVTAGARSAPAAPFAATAGGKIRAGLIIFGVRDVHFALRVEAHARRPLDSTPAHVDPAFLGRIDAAWLLDLRFGVGWLSDWSCAFGSRVHWS